MANKKILADVIGDDIIRLISKHWLKLVVIIAVSGIVATGFKCSCGNMKVEKTPVIKYQRADSK